MGSRLTQVTREPNQTAPQAAATSHHDELQEVSCQDAQDPEQTVDDTTAASATSSDPLPDTPTPPVDSNATGMDQPSRESIDSYSAPDTSAHRRFLDRYPHMAIDPGDDTPAPAPAPAPEPEPPKEYRACLICDTTCNETEPNRIATYPCSRCDNPYCPPCLKNMFVEACRDLSRMPPRCCNQIQLHHVRPFLSQEELDIFKAKYDEWGTPNPFYCPVARCSAFIPNYLLPSKRGNGKGKQRVDSGVGTPTMSMVSCPKCEANICTTCRNLAHEDGICNPLQFHGIDKATADLIERWGYKKCPRCGNGVKKMFGCSHMECRCGAHFCWGCMKSRGQCDGGCGEGSEDDGWSYYEPDFESEFDRDEEKERELELLEPGLAHLLTELTETPAPPEPNLAHVFPHLAPASQTGDDSKTPSTEPVEPTTSSEEAKEEAPPPRFRNLDGGANVYWEDQGLDFGEEPSDDMKDHIWDCDHDFDTAKLTLAAVFTSRAPDVVMECMKCWARIHPEVKMPVAQQKTVAWTTGTNTKRRRIELRSGGVRGTALRPSRSVEGLDTSVSTGTPLSASPASLRSAFSFNARTDAHDADFDAQRVLNLYGSTVALATEAQGGDREANWIAASDETYGKQEASPSTHQAKNTPFSFAYECYTCAVLVCQDCKEDLLAENEARRKAEEEEDALLQEEVEEEKEEEEEEGEEEEEEKEKEEEPVDIASCWNPEVHTLYE